MSLLFDSNIVDTGHHFRHPFSETTIKSEPMFFSADLEFAAKHGKDITRDFLQILPDSWKGSDVILDSRVHMLMPGWYPCIPGWHLDDVPRTRPDGQPDHAAPVYQSEHLTAIIGDAGKTQFINRRIQLEDVPVGEGPVYRVWNEDLQRRIVAGLPGYSTGLMQILPGHLYEFNWQSFHRGMPATKSGWRWFVRLSKRTTRPVTNEIRRQVQVYMPAIEVGW